ncbi:hypothetical protein [Lacipirellula parvula]|uniref:Uncharacterized protein n=1 Tax=Lacipirellula parvula TaxID=2650471 RepID=A0A5K7X276_9BACT|nr:hypothetical protein [Lacipirellula parvula]BBO30570.1 hypothetical protein PLANPX_0182 [Lacipirellula parvula]
MPERQSTFRYFRWTVIALFLIALATLAYREGFRRGYEPDGLATAPTSNSLMLVTYPVGDLVVPLPHAVLQQKPSDFDPLIDLIVATIEHESWMENGTGEGEIQPFPSNNSLVISQTKRVHEQISDLLEQLRRLGGEVDAKQAISLFQSWAATGSGRFHEFQTFPATAEGRTAADQYFSKSMQNIVDVWGPPTFHGKPEDVGFPNWSAAKEFAWWPRGDGIAYMSISLDDESLPRLILGWRPNDAPAAASQNEESPPK